VKARKSLELVSPRGVLFRGKLWQLARDNVTAAKLFPGYGGVVQYFAKNKQTGDRPLMKLEARFEK